MYEAFFSNFVIYSNYLLKVNNRSHCSYIIFRIGGYYYGNSRKGSKAGVVADFNPILLRGYRGYPGIKIRINQRAFQYASTLAGQILNREIIRFQIPNIKQKIDEVLSFTSKNPFVKFT